MGLDNMISVYSRKKFKFPKEVHLGLDFDDTNEPDFYKAGDTEYPYDHFAYDFGYFRKYWDLRDQVCDILPQYDGYGGSVELSKEDLRNIYSVIYKFSKKKYWKEYGNCIWTFDEAIKNIDQVLLNIEWLIDFMDTPEYTAVDAKVYWIDSY